MRSQIFPAIAALAMLATIIPAGAAQAYIGPALGLGMLGAGFGVLMTSASAIFYLFALSVRRAFRRLTRFVMRKDAPDAAVSQNENGRTETRPSRTTT